MGNTEVNRKPQRRPKTLVALLATVALAGGVLFPAAAPSSASAATLQCHVLRSFMNAYFYAGLPQPEGMKELFAENCLGNKETF
jgi:hypothetical protein